MVATISHDHHRRQRGLIGRHFSRGSVLKNLVPLIEDRIQKLMGRLEEAHAVSGMVVSMDDAYAAMASDIITFYIYGHCWDCLEMEHFGNHIRGSILRLLSFVHFTQYAPWLIYRLRQLPLDTLRRVQPGIAAIFDITQVSDGRGRMDAEQKISQKNDLSCLPVFHRLKTTNPSTQEQTPEWLQDEGILLLLAGTDTTAIALSTATFHIYSNDQILRRLRAEIQDAFPTREDSMSVAQLENLPYLVFFKPHWCRVT